MTDNIKPEHYRKGEIDLYEAFSQIFPHNEYRAGMQMIAMRYMFRNKIDRVEDIGKAIYTLERLKEKEIEYAGGGYEDEETTNDDAWQTKIKIAGQYFDEVYFHHDELLGRLLRSDYRYLARDENGDLWAHNAFPHKHTSGWSSHNFIHKIEYDRFPEVKWTDNEPTEIVDLLATRENGGENGK